VMTLIIINVPGRGRSAFIRFWFAA
jgi:hypothetical protein